MGDPPTPGPGHDWIIVALGHPGTVDNVEVDTAYFRGIFPDRCSLQGAYIHPNETKTLVAASIDWPFLVEETKLEMDHQHFFKGKQILAHAQVSHLRLNIYPDGGISRFRAFGSLATTV